MHQRIKIGHALLSKVEYPIFNGKDIYCLNKK